MLTALTVLAVWTAAALVLAVGVGTVLGACARAPRPRRAASGSSLPVRRACRPSGSADPSRGERHRRGAPRADEALIVCARPDVPVAMRPAGRAHRAPQVVTRREPVRRGDLAV